MEQYNIFWKRPCHCKSPMSSDLALCLVAATAFYLVTNSTITEPEVILQPEDVMSCYNFFLAICDYSVIISWIVYQYLPCLIFCTLFMTLWLERNETTLNCYLWEWQSVKGTVTESILDCNHKSFTGKWYPDLPVFP